MADIIPYSASYGDGFITAMYNENGDIVTDPDDAMVFEAYIQAGELEGHFVVEEMDDCRVLPLVKN